MKVKSLLFFLLLSSAFIISSCSDEAKLAKTLTGQTGRWDIDERLQTFIETDPDTTITEMDTIDNIGEIIFYETGTGIWIEYDTTYKLDVAEYFEWENTANMVTVNFRDTVEIVFDIEQVSETEQIWNTGFSTIDDDVTYDTLTQYRLQKIEEIKNL